MERSEAWSGTSWSGNRARVTEIGWECEAALSPLTCSAFTREISNNQTSIELASAHQLTHGLAFHHIIYIYNNEIVELRLAVS